MPLVIYAATSITGVGPTVPEDYYVEIEYQPVVCEDCGEHILTDYYEDGSYVTLWEDESGTTGCLPYQLCDERIISSTYDEETDSIVAVLNTGDTVIVSTPFAPQVFVNVVNGNRLSETYCVPYVGDC